MKEAILKLCRVYHGEADNPFHPYDITGEQWAEQYLRFHIWDAEYSVAQDPQGWYSPEDSTAEDPAEIAYKNCIMCKLRKMSWNDDYDWMKMYFEL